ncbi:NADH-quinone oxidoreductase subunit L [Bermanella marisrubri]|nr:NADH-quinone oxidoreductase subunit L [Bermanella marisrubri]
MFGAYLMVPVILAMAAIAVLLNRDTIIWGIAKCATGIAFIFASLLAVMALFGARTSEPTSWIAITPLTQILMILVSFIALVVMRYSHRYLEGEPRQARFVALLLMTFSAVNVVLLSNHMLLMLVAWITVSLSMHQLLMFYPERPRAALAAHKKFLFARLAEGSLLLAFILLYHVHGTWQIDLVLAAYQGSEVALSFHEQLAAVLIANTALIKCAQLPMHGWLIQVVESPTPVSAALHGGVINMGGFLLMSFAALFSQAFVAQWFVLIVAGLSTVFAAWIMATRISVKVRLAWSTSAQMGLMLVECALGLYELALLHLVAHSCYKAYAFLSAGDAVNQYKQRLLAWGRVPEIKDWINAFLLAGILVGLAILAANHINQNLTLMLSPWLLILLALTTYLAERRSQLHALSIVQLLAGALFLVVSYTLLKSLAALSFSDVVVQHQGYADIWMSVLFAFLFSGYLLQRYALHWHAVQKIQLYLYAGLYLDEWATRITLKVWPIRLPMRMKAKQLQSSHKESLS